MGFLGKINLNKMNLGHKNEQKNCGNEQQQHDNHESEKSASEHYIEYLHELNEVVKKSSEFAPLINKAGNWDLRAFSELLEYLVDDREEEVKKHNYYKNRLESLREKYNELVRYINETGNDEAYQKWKQAQKQGRPKKAIDWERYDLLVRAQLNQKEIAQHLGVSPNTLRKLLRER